jgi:hypothetical protein
MVRRIQNVPDARTEPTAQSLREKQPLAPKLCASSPQLPHCQLAAGNRSRISGITHNGGWPLATRWMFA